MDNIEDSGRSVPDRVTMPLLSRVTMQSLDEDYRHAAERRAAAGESESHQDRSSRRTVAITAVVTLFGVLMTVAAVQTTQNADVDALGRASLVNRIQVEKEAVRELQVRAGELRTANAESETALRELREEEAQVTSRVSRLGMSTGYLAVTGPGLRIRVDDAPDGNESQRVRDDDLLLLVDGLWAAGAEAVAINGQRLTMLTQLQNSGRAIHVNVRPLQPPYVVEAIGDPDTLEGRLLASTHGSVFFSVARALEFPHWVEDDDALDLPAARFRPLRHTERIGAERASDDREESQ